MSNNTHKVVTDNSQRDIQLVKCSSGKHSKYNDGKPCKWCKENNQQKH